MRVLFTLKLIVIVLGVTYFIILGLLRRTESP